MIHEGSRMAALLDPPLELGDLGSFRTDDEFEGDDSGHPGDDSRSYITATDDLVFQDIKDRLEFGDRRDSLSTLRSDDSSGSEAYGTRTSDDYSLVPYGLQPRATYEHGKKNTDIIGITYNGRMRRFVILDAKGITTWQKDVLDHKVTRAMLYPKYEYRLITNVVYAKKHNVYFALGKDFSLKVLNRDFEETCRVNSDLSSVLFMIFNPLCDELITGGVGGTKLWKYHQVAEKTWTEIKPMANYRLTLKHELRNVGGSWVKKVDLDLHLQHLYCCSDTDLYAYDMDGKELFRFERAHNMSITGCAFSMETRLLVTASVDSEVKAWSLGGGLIHTFRGHSRAVTGLLLHPDTSSLVLTSSLDGSVRIWSLATMEPLYSMVVSTDGVLWMGLTDDKLLYLGTIRNITVWSLNRTTTFWAAARSRLTISRLVGGHQKSHRVISVGDDNSVRVFCRKSRKNLSTILPPPALSPLERIRDVTYNRLVNVGYLLVNTKEIWLYTTRTDPACRVTVWDTLQIQEQIIEEEQAMAAADLISAGKRVSTTSVTKRSQAHRATETGQGNEVVCDCCSVCYMNAHAMMWNEEGMCTPIQDNYLLMGLEDGRVLFMDPVVKGKKYFQFQANKDAIVRLTHDRQHQCLWTQCDLGDAALIQIWILPELELEYEVYCPPDVVGYVRLGYSFVTAHTSGSLIHHTLQQYDEVAASTYRPRFGQTDGGTESSFVAFAKADHGGPVTAIDACHKLKIFCSASTDGVVKIWESTKVLLTEIILDSSLSTALFLNERGDLLVGFKNHLFHIEHSKVCPSLEVESEADSDYAESEVYEDPAVMYEGVTENPDPVNLENYLVPFDLDFSQDFLEGKKLLMHPKEEPQEDVEDDLVSEVSAAPTTVYMSPSGTPRNLSLLDLTLDNNVTKHDLLTNMEKLSQKHALLQQNNNWTFHDIVQDDFAADAEVMRAFQMPQFGESPGPSPSPSPPSTIATPSDFDVSEGGESTAEELDEEEDRKSLKSIPPPATQTPDTETSLPNTLPEKSKETTAPKPSFGQQTEVATASGSRLDKIKIDAKSLMREANLTKTTKEKVQKEADHKHVRPPPETRTTDKTKSSRNIKKKEITRERKRPQAQKRETKAKHDRATADTSSPRTSPSRVSRPSAKNQTSHASGGTKVKQKESKGSSTKQSDPTDTLLISQVSMTSDDQGSDLSEVLQDSEAEESCSGSDGDTSGVTMVTLPLLSAASSGQSPLGAALDFEEEFVVGDEGRLSSASGLNSKAGRVLSGHRGRSTTPQSGTQLSALQRTNSSGQSDGDDGGSDGDRSGSQNAIQEDLQLCCETQSHQAPDQAPSPSDGFILPDIVGANSFTTNSDQTNVHVQSPNLALGDGYTESKNIDETMKTGYQKSVSVTTSAKASIVSQSLEVTSSLTYPESLYPDHGRCVSAAGFTDRQSEPPGNRRVSMPVTNRTDTPKSILKSRGLSLSHIGGRVPSLTQHKVGFHDNLDRPDTESRNKAHRFPVAQDLLVSPSGSRSQTPSLVLHPDWVDQNTRGQTSDWVNQSFDPNYQNGSRQSPGQQASDAAQESVSPSITEKQRGLHLTPDGEYGNDASRYPLDRGSSPAVTIISDYGSEWTIPAPEGSHFIRISERDGNKTLHDSGDLSNGRKIQSAQITRHRYSQDRDSKPARPHTAFVLPKNKEELEMKFRSALVQFQTLSEEPQGSDLWFKNDGKSYDPDKMIERHQLLQMQKHLRAKSAQDRRLAIERQKQERNDGILERSTSSIAKLRSRSESAFGSGDRPDTAATSWRPGTQAGHRYPSERPTTAATIAGGYCNYHSTHRGGQSSGMNSQTSLTGKRPTTSSGAVMGRGVAETELPDKTLLNAELPYRARIRPQSQSSTQKSNFTVEKVDIKLLDPRNPSAHKVHSSKSIPSKCTRYVFIDQTRDAAGRIVPTPLEEQLIMERFPEKQEDWLSGFPRTPRMCHGIPSLDLRNLVFDSKGHVQPQHAQYTSLTDPV